MGVGYAASRIAQDRKHTRQPALPPIEDAFDVEGELINGTRNLAYAPAPPMRPIAQDVIGEGRMPGQEYQYQEHKIKASPGIPPGGLNSQFGFPNTTAHVPQRNEVTGTAVRQMQFWGNHQTLQGVGVSQPVTVVPVPSTSQTQRKYIPG